MPATYVPIATQVLGSDASSVTFSSIPATYTDLVLVFSARAVSGGPFSVTARINGDTANYSDTYLTGDGTTATSARTTGESSLNPFNISSGAFGTYSFFLMNYSNTTTFKTLLGRAGSANYRTSAFVELWRSTAAITTFLVSVAGGNFITGSTFTLYGIKAA